MLHNKIERLVTGLICSLLRLLIGKIQSLTTPSSTVFDRKKDIDIVIVWWDGLVCDAAFGEVLMLVTALKIS